MYTISIYIILALLQTGLSKIAEDTDLNALSSNYDAVEENAENFEFGLVTIDRLTPELIEEICKDSEKLIYIQQDDMTISCVNFFHEEINEEELNRVRRSADEVEGSGNDEDKTETTTEEVRTPEETPTETTPEETTPEASVTPEAEIPEVPEVPNTTEESEDKKSETVDLVPVTVQATGATILDIVPIESIEKPAVKEEAPEKSEGTPPPVIQQEKEEPSEKTVQNSDKDPKKDVETLSGRTLIDTPKRENTKIVNEEKDDTVQTKESTEPKKAGSKDTTILVFLFVAVVVVGVLAFGYNFIKKRRQQSADLERVERNSVKTSLQNLAKPEGGEPEKKPLIGNSKEVEMVDMKKQPEEQKENGTTEQVVKS